MNHTEITQLKAIVRRHLDVHNRLPCDMALKLLAAIEKLESTLSAKAAA